MPIFGRVFPITWRYWSVVEAAVGVEEAIPPAFAAAASMRMVRVEVAGQSGTSGELRVR
jgi:hypothetical protein